MSAIAPRRKGWRPEAPRRKGWCPGALRPMETGDGLLARVRAPRGRLSLDQAAAVAESAIACGNGAIGLSARGNLHLRGLSERTLARSACAPQRRSASSTPTPRSSACATSSRVRSTTSILKPCFDLGPSVAALETRLAEDEGLRRLPAKFSFVLDALGRLPLGDVDADIRFEASRDGRFAVFLAGEDALAAECAPAETGDAAARLGRAFFALPAPARTRRGGCARSSRGGGASAVFAEAGLASRSRALRSQRRASLRDVLGAHEFGAAIVVGAAAAFGEIEAAAFKALIERARALGASGLRLTPWRAFLIAGLDRRGAASMVGSIAKLGFIAERGRAAPAHRGLPGRARLHARPSAGARGRGALGGAACRRARASFSMSAAAPRGARDRLRRRRP